MNEMKVLIGVSHPKHAYIFKNPVNELVKRGHEVKVIAVEKEITEYLLKRFNMPYTVIGKNQPKLYRKLLVLPKWEYLTYKIAKKFKPDIFALKPHPIIFPNIAITIIIKVNNPIEKNELILIIVPIHTKNNGIKKPYPIVLTSLIIFLDLIV